MLIQCQICIRTSELFGVSGSKIPWRCPHCKGRHLVSGSFDLVGALQLVDRLALKSNLTCSPMVMQHLTDAIACFNADVPRAAAVMVRLALEQTCIERGAQGNNLQAKVEDLSQKGVFSRRLVVAATAMRLFGNAGAHTDDDGLDENGDQVEAIIKLAMELLAGAKH